MVTHPTAGTEPDMTLSRHPASEYTGCCHTAPAVGAGVSTPTTEPSDSCGLASALSEPNVRRTLRLHYVRDVWHTAPVVLCRCKTLAHRVPWPSRTPGPRQHILRLSRRPWLLGPSLPLWLAAGCLLHCWRASNGLLCSAHLFCATLGRCFMPGLRASERPSALCPTDLETFPFWVQPVIRLWLVKDYDTSMHL